MRKRLLDPLAMVIIGLCAGVLSRLLDIYTQNLGEIFSQMAVWILFGTLISIYSNTPKKAAENILTFCLGMLIAYYAAAALSHGVYGTAFIIGWTVFALCAPVMAYVTWMTKQKGLLPKIISIGIVAVSVLSSVLLFDGFRIYDLLIDGCLVFFLFFADVQRDPAGRRSKKTGMAHHRRNSNTRTDDMRQQKKGPEATGPSFFSAAAAVLRQTQADYDRLIHSFSKEGRKN